MLKYKKLQFEEGPSDADDIVKELIFSGDKFFSALAGAKIKTLFNLKKKLSLGRIILAEIRKTSEIQRYLTAETIEYGYDFFIIIDKILWTRVITNRRDKIRLIRHELRHIDSNLGEFGKWGIRGHEIEDFHKEVESNKDKPRWAEELAILMSVMYEAEDDPQGLTKGKDSIQFGEKWNWEENGTR